MAWTVKLEPSKSNCYIDMWEPKTGHREKHWSCAEGTGEGFRRQKCIVADFTFNRACCFTVMLQYHIWGKKNQLICIPKLRIGLQWKRSSWLWRSQTVYRGRWKDILSQIFKLVAKGMLVVVPKQRRRMSGLDKSMHLIPRIISQENYFWEIILQYSAKQYVLFLSSISYNSFLTILTEYGYVLKELLFICSFHPVLRHLPSPLPSYRVTVRRNL